MKYLMNLAIAATMAGCALPSTQVRSGSPRPALAVQGAPAGAQLYVDGLPAGDAAGYDGKAGKLLVEEGMHRIEVKLGGNVVHSQQVFAGAGETATVVVASENAK